ncbi:hypothetical protein WH47_11555 [Habropoda laboriosa]|uniref:Transmembrane protein n=2 Tax=Habropoda laboriosa TaxID=597456 RepID=A0A0L7QM30_9HYME|nr:hypothetical protein WH47_11555 [Habropoda laboriosa]
MKWRCTSTVDWSGHLSVPLEGVCGSSSAFVACAGSSACFFPATCVFSGGLACRVLSSSNCFERYSIVFFQVFDLFSQFHIFCWIFFFSVFRFFFF